MNKKQPANPQILRERFLKELKALTEAGLPLILNTRSYVVASYDHETGDVCSVYDSIGAAAKGVGVDISAISHAIYRQGRCSGVMWAVVCVLGSGYVQDRIRLMLRQTTKEDYIGLDITSLKKVFNVHEL